MTIAAEDVLLAARAFRGGLYDLSQNGRYSARQRETFARAREGYGQAMLDFFFDPCCGAVSPKYEAALAGAEQGSACVEACSPEDRESQQAVVIAADDAGDALEAVTETG
ncbi:hypothetical protein KCG44_10265 [Pacificimonas sp. WHA3]|uniref:Uncharacterized protein n=1 Tax=Pacificimonas pallii TaxID=2827236 RepID=A0ABS6SFH8_9SPHN|nr:hypothetical protein [Pacificimonas pallii]MBV7257165.1 hypothetical protein [Pacificimonas pallii]